MNPPPAAGRARLGRRRSRWRSLPALLILLSAVGPAAAHWLLYDGRSVCRGTPGTPGMQWCALPPQGLAAPPVPVPGSGHAWLVGRDGAVVRLDLADGRTAPALALPEPVRALHASSDGRFLLAVEDASLRLLDPQGQPIKHWAVRDRQGRTGRVLAVADLPSRRSFVVALQGLAELWEISYDPAAGPVFEGLVHDYRMGEGIARPGYLGVRRTPLNAALQAIDVDGRVPWLLARADGRASVLHLDVRRSVAQWPTWPDAAAVIDDGGHWSLVLADGLDLQWIDPRRWQPTRRVPVGAPILGLRAAARGATLWVLSADAAGAHRLTRWPASAAGPAAAWQEAGAQVGPWWVDADGRTVTLQLAGARAGVLQLDGQTLAPRQWWPRTPSQGPGGLLRLPR